MQTLLQTHIKINLSLQRHIPSDKIRIIHGCWNPSVILDLVAYGIDLFDSSYPYVITEQGSALIFPNDEISVQKHISEEMENTGEKLKKPQINVVHPPETDENNCPKRMKLSNESRYFMSLRNPRYKIFVFRFLDQHSHIRIQ